MPDYNDTTEPGALPPDPGLPPDSGPPDTSIQIPNNGPTSVVAPTTTGLDLTGSLTSGPTPAAPTGPTSFESMPQDPSSTARRGPIYGSPPAPPTDPNSLTATQYTAASVKNTEAEKDAQKVITKADEDLAFKTGNILTESSNADKKRIDDLAIMQANLDNIRQVNNRGLKEDLAKIASTKIDPDHWWNSKSTGGKIAAGIGVILGGLGQGLQMWGPHGNKQATNTALEQVDKAIHDDIDAQKESKNDMWKQFQAKTGIADNEENRQQWSMQHSEASYLAGKEVFRDKLAAAVAQSQDPIAKANGAIAVAKLDQHIADEKRNLGVFHEQQAAALNSAIAKQRQRESEHQRELEKIVVQGQVDEGKERTKGEIDTKKDIAVAAANAPEVARIKKIEILEARKTDLLKQLDESGSDYGWGRRDATKASLKQTEDELEQLKAQGPATAASTPLNSLKPR